MEYVQVTKDMQFSRIIHGMWRLLEWNLSIDELARFVEECLEMGVTTFDTADIYGGLMVNSRLGELFASRPDLRNRITLISKAGIKIPVPESGYTIGHYDSSYDHIVHVVDDTLERMNIDSLDVLLIHRPDLLMDGREVARAFADVKKAGKVRAFGVSNFYVPHFEHLQEFCEEPLMTNQIEVSPVCFEHFKNGMMDYLMQHQIHPMIWSPNAGGRIFTSNEPKFVALRDTLNKIAADHGTSADAIVYAWLLKHPVKMMPIVGSGRIGRVLTAVDALNIDLTQEEWYRIAIASGDYEVI